MENLLDERFVAHAGAKIYHAHIEQMVAVAEISEVYEIAFAAHKDGVGELKVSVDGRGGVGGIGNELADSVFLRLVKEGILLQQAVVTVLDVLELRRVHVHLMQLFAHLGKLRRILLHFLRMVRRGTRVGHLPRHAAETDAVTDAVRHIVAGLRGGNAQIEHLAGQNHLVQGLLHLARIVELHHDGGVRLVVEAFSVGAFAGVDIVVQIYSKCFHINEQILGRLTK